MKKIMLGVFDYGLVFGVDWVLCDLVVKGWFSVIGVFVVIDLWLCEFCLF